jgi:hypothetical protein
MPNSRYDPSDSRYWEEPESNEDLDESYYYADDPEDYDPEDDWDNEFDCGFIPGYGCQLAGTEECDWECPYVTTLEAHPAYPNVTLAPIGDIIAAIPLDQLKQPPDDTIQP